MSIKLSGLRSIPDMITHQNGTAYGAFISHSGSLDIAKQLSTKLARVGISPWQFSKSSGLKVFFDRNEIRTGDILSDVITPALQNSKYFILLASKAAAQSTWVSQELEIWLVDRPASDILLVVLDGSIVWDHQQNDFNWNLTDCLPAILKGRYQEACWEDLRPLSSSAERKRKKALVNDAIVSIAAKIKGVSKNVLEAKLRGIQKRTRMIVGVVATIMLVLAGFSGVLWYKAETPADKAYNEGRKKLESRTNWNDILIAMKYFARALELNPKHVLALLADADAHILLIGYGAPTDPVSDLQQAEDELKLARLFGGDITSEYHRVRGRLLLYKDKDVLGARQALATAVEIDPNNIDARFAMASTFTFLGQHNEAIEETKRALSIVGESVYGQKDNRYIHAKGQLAWTYYYAGDYELAISESLSIVEKDTSPQANKFLAHSYLQLGNYEEAIRRYLKAGGDDINREPNFYPTYTCARMRAGQLSLSDAKNEIQIIRQRGKQVSPYRLAQGYACIGDTNSALEELKRGRDEHDLYVVWSAVDPLLSSLKENAEFQDYLKTIGLGQAIIR
jgi:tetratricopeptide (TPR) repeat protein